MKTPPSLFFVYTERRKRHIANEGRIYASADPVPAWVEGPQVQEPAFWHSGILAFAFWHSSVLHLWRDSRILASHGKRIPVNEPYTPKTYVDSVPTQAGGSGAAASAPGIRHSVRHVSAPLHLNCVLPLVEASAERGGWGYVLVAAPCIPTHGRYRIYGCCTEQFSRT